ncbi:non-ribosomal peptide synthetase [Streptomyces sp. Ru62]|uniref:non-ribosomal peptide synthetase n=1 Tax=Streptomyces sp. Ru62 TaxID=2080745 RepID=UPI001C6867B6|nr:non-ribosomal peptide synthetase [Streptomyces sp. Ru62]
MSGMSGAAPEPADLLDRFRSAVDRCPTRIAVAASDGELDFAQLDLRTRRVAARLGARGAGRGSRVGVCVGRGTGLVVALLGVWRAGAAYVPLDPRYPRLRLERMAAEARLDLLITDGGTALAPEGVQVVALDEACTREPEADGRPDSAPSPLDPAYVLFTSGSTGTPKGVEITRGGVASLITALEQAGAYAPLPRVVAWNASVGFDASVQQWTRVCRGDTVVVLDDEDRLRPERLADVLEHRRVDDLDLTPSHWEILREVLLTPRTDGRRLRLFMGGEPVPRSTWREIAAATDRGVLEALNLYGPTETTVDATSAPVTGDTPTIGRGLPGGRVHLLDDRLRPVPDGAAGEIFISGDRVANGYAGHPALTAASFVADPFGPPGTRMYASGDQARRRADGTLEYLGRRDRQEKIRGFRVELGEVERVLEGHPDVTTAHAVVRGRGTAQAHLVLYATTAGSAVPAGELTAFAARVLPDHMLPSAVVVLERMPLTVNGKIDEAALPEPAKGATGGAEQPSGVAEVTARVWSEVLGRAQIRPGDDFFALGGHSLTALAAFKQLRDTLDLPLSIRDIYRHPKLADLIDRLESMRGEQTGGQTRERTTTEGSGSTL